VIYRVENASNRLFSIESYTNTDTKTSSIMVTPFLYDLIILSKEIALLMEKDVRPLWPGPDDRPVVTEIMELPISVL
jgi:hypothetical protein